MRRIHALSASFALTCSIASAAPTIDFVRIGSNPNAPLGSETWLIQYSNPGASVPFPRIESIKLTLTSPSRSILFQTNLDFETGELVLAATDRPVAPGTRARPTGTYLSLPNQLNGYSEPANLSQNAEIVRLVSNGLPGNQTTPTSFIGAVTLAAGGYAFITSDPTLATNYFQIGDTKHPIATAFGVVDFNYHQFGVGTLLSNGDPRQSLTTTGDNPTIYTIMVGPHPNNSTPVNFAIDTNLTNNGSIDWIGAAPEGVTVYAEGDVLYGTVERDLRRSWDIPLLGSGPARDTAILRSVYIPEPLSLGIFAGLGVVVARRRR